MTYPTTWQPTNEQYLTAALTWLRLRLQHLITPAETIDLTEATKTITTLETADALPPLIILRQRFGLSRFEQETLLLCVAMELDSEIASLCAQANGNPQQTYPTFALAMRLFDDPAWDVLSPERPLRYWRMIEVMQMGAQPLTTSPLRADERIVNYVKGLNYLDDRLIPLLMPLEVTESELSLPPSQQAVVEKATRYLQQLAAQQRVPLLQLLGIDQASKQLVAWHIATALGLRIYSMPLALLPSHTAELENLARLWQRESLLLPIALYIDAHDADEQTAGPASTLGRFLVRSDGLFFLGTRDVRQDIRRATLDLDVAKPTALEQQQTWQTLLTEQDQAAQLSARLAGQFNLGMAAIHQVTQATLAETPQNGTPLADGLWQACLMRTRPRLDTLAERIDPKATWDDIVLRDDLRALLLQITNQVRQRGKVYEDWGFRQRMNRGLGLVTLFAGESGTGKTMAAEVIANNLNLNLYRIDLSAVVSKYIGETEKNLRQLFDAAEDGGAILFFDEADALFGKRSQVKDSHDRYANIETNYLLQRMEAYQGLAILASNMKSGLDDAFTRRLRFIVNFPVPDRDDRQHIWQKIFPSETPLDTLDYERLARFELPGGSIYNAALNAAFLAAQDERPVSMSHVLSALRTEFLKSDRLIDDTDFI
ncbi:MAG: ATP-binding protein [Anaerolineales bacterium]|nr:ATP-binding protein [Anaerolineales bacterium]